MALIACPECKTNVSDQAVSCPYCGYPIRSLAATAAGPAAYKPLHREFTSPEKEPLSFTRTPQTVKTAKSRGIFVILGLFFGMLGIHNFYAGYFGRGVAQILIVLLLGWIVIGFVIVAIWVITELCVVTHDAAGDAFV